MVTAPTADNALSFKPGRYEIEAAGELVIVVTIKCRDCADAVAHHVEPIMFDELAEDVWRHEKVHAHD